MHTHNEIAFNFVPAWNAVEGKQIPQRPLPRYQSTGMEVHTGTSQKVHLKKLEYCEKMDLFPINLITKDHFHSF